MGYMMAMGACIGCKKLFSFNPNLVPSSSAVTGKREPICLECVERLNPIRVKNGLEPIKVLPGAYEAAEEYDLER